MTGTILPGWILCLAAVVGAGPARADQVDGYIQTQMSQHQIPGVALAVLRGGKTIKPATYGLANLELKAPVTPATVFELGSISKQPMWTPARLNNGQPTRYGLGWFIGSLDGHKNLGHGGSTSGFSASIQRFPDDNLAVIVLTNTDEQIATTLAERAATFYFQ